MSEGGLEKIKLRYQFDFLCRDEKERNPATTAKTKSKIINYSTEVKLAEGKFICRQLQAALPPAFKISTSVLESETIPSFRLRQVCGHSFSLQIQF